MRAMKRAEGMMGWPGKVLIAVLVTLQCTCAPSSSDAVACSTEPEEAACNNEAHCAWDSTSSVCEPEAEPEASEPEAEPEAAPDVGTHRTARLDLEQPDPTRLAAD